MRHRISFAFVLAAALLSFALVVGPNVVKASSQALATYLTLDGNAKQAYQKTITLSVPPGSYPVTSVVGTVFAAPAGKRLVIEYIDGVEQQPFHQLVLQTWVNGAAADHPLCAAPGPYPSAPSLISMRTHIYADPGSAVQLIGTASYSATVPDQASVTVSGYLVDLP